MIKLTLYIGDSYTRTVNILNTPITEIAKNMSVKQNVTMRVLDATTWAVVQEYTGHNQATNTMLNGICQYLAGGGNTDSAAILKAFTPNYISLGTMGLLSQDEDADGLPSGIGGDGTSLSDDEATRFEAYMNQAPGYGADGYPGANNNDRPALGLGPMYDADSDEGIAINCELISDTFPRAKILRRSVVAETNAETPETMDVVVSAMISTGALAQFRGDNDYIFITEAGLWTRTKFSSSGTGLLAGYRIKPPNDINWDMTDSANRQILKENIIRVGINQVVQVIWKIQIGSVERVDLSGGTLRMLTSLIDRSATTFSIPRDVTQIGDFAFAQMRSLTAVNIPDTVTSIGQDAFMSCINLTTVRIPNSVASIGSVAFTGCSNLTSIIIDKAEGSISGAPWGAPDATVTWLR